MPKNPTPQESQEPVAVTPAEELPAPFRSHPAEVALRTLGKLDQAFAAMGAQLAATFAQELRGAVGAIINEMRNQRLICVPCGVARDKWDRENEAAVAVAKQAHAEAVAALAEGEEPPSLVSFLPEDIRPDPSDLIGANGHMPQVLAAVCQIAGTDMCDWHLANYARNMAQQEQATQVPAQQPQLQGRQILVPPAGMPASVAARIAGQNMPGVLPGLPGQ